MHKQTADHKFVWGPPDEPKLLLNHYLDICWSVHMAKFSQLCEALIDTVNREQFIAYGLVGRSIVEHAAVMRHYFSEKIQPAVNEAVQRGTVSDDQLFTIVSQLDHFLKGSRFNWEAFFAGNFDQLLDKNPQTAGQQARVGKCITQWAKETPQVQILYDLFCDLVHPNIGSTLLVMKKWPEGVGFGGSNGDGQSVGRDVFVRTLAGLLGMFKDILRHLNVMLLLQIHEPEKDR